MSSRCKFSGGACRILVIGRRPAGRLPRSLGVLLLALSPVRASTTHPKQFNDFFIFQKFLHFSLLLYKFSKNRKNCLIV